MTEAIVLARYQMEIEAELAREALAAAGIEARVEGGNLSMLSPAYAGGPGSVTLVVKKEDAAAAHAVLFPKAAAAPQATAAERRSRRFMAIALLAVLAAMLATMFLVEFLGAR
jgi:hypothetical protein